MHPCAPGRKLWSLLERKDFFALTIFFGLGNGILAPYNSFLMAIDYFQLRYPGMHMERQVILTYMPIASTTIILFSIVYPPVSLRTRVLTGFIGFTLCTLVVPAVELLGIQGTASMRLSLASVGAVGLLDGIS